VQNIGLLLFIAILPVLLILLFVYNKDKKKEPLFLLLQLFLLGIVSCFIVILLSKALGFLPFMQGDLDDKRFFDIILYSFLGVALIEEFCKWLMLYLKGYNNKEFDELYDIIVYAVFVSLGFAFFENLIYIFSSQALRTAIVRALSSVPGHACDAIFMGYYLTIAKEHSYNKRKDLEKKNILLSIVVPTLLHGFYDFCLMSNINALLIVFFIFIIFLYIISLKKLKEISNNNRTIKYQNTFCKACGAKVEGRFCNNCGTSQE